MGNWQVTLQQHDADISYQVMARASGLSSDEESHIIRDYFNLSTPLGPLAELWAKHDSRFSKLQKFIQGILALRTAKDIDMIT
jgi:hypothetical protein